MRTGSSANDITETDNDRTKRIDHLARHNVITKYCLVFGRHLSFKYYRTNRA